MKIEELESILDTDTSLTKEQEIEIVKLIVVKWEEQQKREQKEEEIEKLKVLPKTLDEAVTLILSDMSSENLNILKETERDDLIKYHHGWGTGIRNSFGLWGANDELIKSICNTPCHPDDASMKIIEAVWDELHNKPLQ